MNGRDFRLARKSRVASQRATQAVEAARNEGMDVYERARAMVG